jgi:rhamnosyltransferase
MLSQAQVISVVIPVWNGGDDLKLCLAAIGRQRVAEEVEVVVIDSESTDGSAEVARDWGARVHSIPQSEFRHGRTRNLGARLARGDILVFTSQDASAASDTWLAVLVGSLRSYSDAAGAYGRQVPKLKAKPPERFFLEFLYGADFREQRVETGDELTAETTLFSNVNSAIRRSVWEQYPFAEDMVMSEDQEWCARVLLAGYCVVYEPAAAVLHSHDYSLVTAFRRFFDSGVSADRAYMAGKQRSVETLRRMAAAYAVGEVRWLWSTGRRRWLPYAAAYEGAKFAGLTVGRRHNALPRGLKRRLTAYPSYWT